MQRVAYRLSCVNQTLAHLDAAHTIAHTNRFQKAIFDAPPGDKPGKTEHDGGSKESTGFAALLGLQALTSLLDTHTISFAIARSRPPFHSPAAALSDADRVRVAYTRCVWPELAVGYSPSGLGLDRTVCQRAREIT